MSSTYGERFRLTIFGQSHAPAIGVTMEGLPAGVPVDLDRLQQFLDRRAPGQSRITTSRKEPDAPEFVSGLVEGRTCGAPVTAIIRNTNTRSGTLPVRHPPGPAPSRTTPFCPAPPGPALSQPDTLSVP